MSHLPNTSQNNSFGSSCRPTGPPYFNTIGINVPNNSHIQIDFYVNNPPPPLPYSVQPFRPPINQPFSVTENKNPSNNYIPSSLQHQFSCLPSGSYTQSGSYNPQLQANASHNESIIYNNPPPRLGMENMNPASCQYPYMNNQNYQSPALINIELNNYVNSPGLNREPFVKSEKNNFSDETLKRSSSEYSLYSDSSKVESYYSSIQERNTKSKRCSRSVSPRDVKYRPSSTSSVSKKQFSEKRTHHSRSRSPVNKSSYLKESKYQRYPSENVNRRLIKNRSNHSCSRSPKNEKLYVKETRHKNKTNQNYSKQRRSYSSHSVSPPPKENRSGVETVGSPLTNSDFLKNDKCETQREKLLEKWRQSSECAIDESQAVWTRTAPADLYYKRQTGNTNVVEATEKLKVLCEDFENVLVKRAELVRSQFPPYQPPPRKKRMKLAKHKSVPCSSSSSGSESEHEDCTVDELERKKLHPYRLHPELWYNDPGEVNDGPLCRCSAKARRSGIRHNIYAGELSLKQCQIFTNNADKLFHYRITISPPTNFLIRTPTIINYDEHEYIFEGFSMFSHGPLYQLPVCKVIRFNIEYTILYEEEKLPENFTIRELDLFYSYLFHEILELVDLDLKAAGDSSGCSQFHFMPRFVRELPDNGKEILPMNEVLKYLKRSSEPLIDEKNVQDIIKLPQHKWQSFTEDVKGMVVTYPGRKPCSLRVDQLDRDQGDSKKLLFPEIVHFGIRPPQLSYAGNPEYQKAWREYVKFRHLLANMPKPSSSEKMKLEEKENKLQDMRTQSKMKRDVTVTVSSENFYRTGIMCDIVQHAMLIPVLVSHLRFHRSLDILEEKIDYKFKNRYFLQLALTHPSYRENFGTNPDHARNSLTNCGIRQPVYGDRRIHYMNTRKRGINTLINIMSRFGKKTETESNITHNERLEFLGDAVVEFVTSIHLFHMFPDLEEGGLATYRAAIVQNQHLAVLAKTLNLEEFMLYAHGSDLCHDLELRHAMANCFEALMGALFLDGGIEVADKVFGETLFKNEPKHLYTWVNYPPHPLQEQEPLGDRRWISSFVLLQNLAKFEESIGVRFNHIRLLARAFTDRSIGYTNLTLGSNQRLEFLGDTVLQLIASEYLYKYFPEHHEGHLSLLRSSLVNNRTQSVVCNDLGMASYALYSNPKAELKTKDRADLLEAFLGALYVDKGLEYCQTFCNVCFFPRLQDFIMHQDWNDPKSKLQQCCLTLRTMEGGEPEIPVYKVIECMGPTNTRIYTVAVYFKGQRLAKASGHSIQQAEMNAAKNALERSQGLFPQLDHQKRVISKSMKKQRRSPVSHNRSSICRYNYNTHRRSGSRSRHNRSHHSRSRRSRSPEVHRDNRNDTLPSYRRSKSPSSEGRQRISSSLNKSDHYQNRQKRQRSRSQNLDSSSDRDYKSKKQSRSRRSKSHSRVSVIVDTPSVSPYNKGTNLGNFTSSNKVHERKHDRQSFSNDSTSKEITKVLVPSMKKEDFSGKEITENLVPVFKKEEVRSDQNYTFPGNVYLERLPIKTENTDNFSSNVTETIDSPLQSNSCFTTFNYPTHSQDHNWQHQTLQSSNNLTSFNIPPPYPRQLNAPNYSSFNNANVCSNEYSFNNVQNYPNEMYNCEPHIKVERKDFETVPKFY